MNYPGNEALGEETKERLLRTFTQTIDLAARGGIQEALLGCDFILRMDPLFQPARLLHERLSVSSGSVEVEDLRLPAASAAPPAQPTGFGTVQMPAIRMPPPAPPAAPAPVQPVVDPAAVRDALQRAFDKRDFAGVVALATQQSTLIAGDPALRELAEAAQAHAEAEPYIRRFLDGARQAIAKGDRAEADKLLQKASSLDPEHPEIAEMQAPAATLEDDTADIPAELSPLGELPTDLGLEALPDEMSFAEFSEPAAASHAGFSLEEAEPMPALGGAPPARVNEGDSRIAELLDEGQTALDRGEYQLAIDAWSRIFLIDIDHGEAARRIEQARKLKAESERQLEELFHEGASKYEAADAEGAKAIFERVLAQQPNHLAAREYLEQIEAGRVRGAVRPSGAVKPPIKAAAVEPAVLKEEILVPPEPGAAPKSAPKKSATPEPGASKAPTRRPFAMVGGAVLLVALAAGWYLFSHRDRFFPNSKPPATPTTAQQDPIARATVLHDQGKTAVAVAQLRRLQPDDLLYEKAQALITQWQAAEQPAKPPVNAEVQAKREGLLTQARAAYAERLYLRALPLFDEAGAIAPLDGTESELREDAHKQTEALEKEITFMSQGEYEIALRDLWRLHELDKNNRDVVRLMVDSYYNLGIKDLQREAPADAVGKFKEGLGLDPSDPGLMRLARFSNGYQNRAQDLQYRIFVKYLAAR